MKFPCIEIDLNKIRHTANVIVDKGKKKDIDTFIVTKVYCAVANIEKASM